MHVSEPRVRETSETEGVGDIVLTGRMRGSLAFANVMEAGDTCDIVIEYGDSFEECEVAIGADGSLVRGEVWRALHANGTVDTNHVSFPPGIKTVIMSVGAHRAGRLLDGGIDTESLAAGAVETDKIEDAAVTLAKLDAGYVPAGSIWLYAGAAAPSGWLLCFGQAVSRTVYGGLFTAIGTIYGVGDGSTTFNVPDLRGRVPAGQDDMGGTSANRLTGLSGGLDGDVLGVTGGAQSHTLTLTEMAPHDHGGSTGAGTPHRHGMSDEHGADDVGALASQTGYRFNLTGNPHHTDNESAHIHPIASAGGGAAHNNVQPTIILNYVIKAH